MSVVAEAAEFFALVEKSQLLEDERIQFLRSELNSIEEAGALAEWLIQNGHLTRFQANHLLAGRYRGLVFGPYLLLDRIGKGGMGTVYLAEHAKFKRKVALKVLATEFAKDKMAVERFTREGRAAAALCHPNIVRVHHAGSAANTHYLVMEYVEGATLEQILDRRGPFSVSQAAKIAIQAAAGLHHAHEKGFVHRDIKPENLMLTKSGAIKILDLGLTKDVSGRECSLTGIMNSQVVLGTIDYLSPEQAMQGEVEPRSDIYSLGATLFTLITGHSPYEGEPMRQKLLQHQLADSPDLCEFRSDVPRGMADVVLKMMAKKPDDRYRDALAVVEALLPWATQEGDSSENLVLLPSDILKTITTRDSALTPTVFNVIQKTPTEPDLNRVLTVREPLQETKHEIDWNRSPLAAESVPDLALPEIPTDMEWNRPPTINDISLESLKSKVHSISLATLLLEPKIAEPMIFIGCPVQKSKPTARFAFAVALLALAIVSVCVLAMGLRMRG